MNKCGDCANFLGMGDWDLCCKEKHEGYPFGFLCYEDTNACEKFTQTSEVKTGYCPVCDKEITVVASGMNGRCPYCNHRIVLRSKEVSE